MGCSPVGFGGAPIPTKRTSSDPHRKGNTALWGALWVPRVGARAAVFGKFGWVQTRNTAANPLAESRSSGFGASGLRGSAGGSWQERAGGVFEAGVAEADGNRTRRGCVATSSTGFEVRGPHQRDNRFRGRVYRKMKRPESRTFWVACAAVLLNPQGSSCVAGVQRSVDHHGLGPRKDPLSES